MSIRELARLAGVSKTTAAYAIRNSPRVSEAQRKRIQALAEEHGYQPNPLVKAYMNEVRKGDSVRSRQCSLCYLSAFLDRDDLPRHEVYRFEKEIIAGATQEAVKLGYPFEVLTWNPREMSAQRMSQIIVSRGIQGLIVGPRGTDNPELDLDWSKLAGVAYGRSIRKPDLNRIAANLLQAIIDFIPVAFQRNYRSIIFALDTQTEDRVGYQWLGGANVLQTLYGRRKVAIIFDRYDQTVEKLARKLGTAQAAVVLGPSGLMDPLTAMGFKIPENLGFVAIDDERHNVTSIRQPNLEIGQLAVDQLSMQVECARFGPSEIPSLQMISCGWHEGETLPMRKSG